MTPGARPESEADDLAALGWRAEDAAAFAERARPGERPARVARVHRGAATVWTAPGEEVRAPFAPAIDAGTETTVATGDWVVLAEGDELTAILPRRSAFVRADPTGDGRTQVVAANVDVVLLVHSLVPGANLRRLERELVLAWESGATPVVVLNKADLAADVDVTVAEVQAVAPGVDVYVTSCEDDRGLEPLAAAATGRTVALVGASGVGKSTMVNRLLGRDVQATSEVRAGDHRGRHTTTSRELLPLPGGGLLIDTPGMRAVGVAEADEGLAQAFSDVEGLAVECRFRDCAHDTEPGCAVRTAVESGRLDADRLASYRRLEAELEVNAQRRAEGWVRAEARARERAQGRVYKAAPKRPR